ncbi:Na(+)-translocating NADH-quinone reductase subunit C [Methylococcus sp. EFPC2]|uniref:Na(+)-translocating NADH-quinone reductase subunit C n=1 Tax=Methylococcus sp. EFPC2 TaxID=2812648 RepID=UPI00196868E2|nr:Na(+)-translocating NADH-quinone reductase subunit C [Methylococcus sp. EFPC2]QSA95903.1 Na(+)-translocating NADH-quinone reductase subunit C [Methylococcus sp. EFPC2]
MPNSNQTAQFSDKFAGWVERANVYAQRILSLPNDSFEKTIAVAFALCLVGAVLVSGSAVILKPLQVANKEADEKVNILEVVGLLEKDTNVDEAFKKFEAKIVDLETGDYIDAVNPATYNQRKAAKDPGSSYEIPADKDIAKIGRKPRYAKVYLVKEEGKTKAVILPVNGYGLWSTMYGYLALEADGQTVIGLNLFDQAETPGLGGEVVNPKWKALWKGKKVYKESGEAGKEFFAKDHTEVGEPVLGLVKGSVDPSKPGSEHQVDGLAGATLTSNGVTNLVRYWLSSEGFAPYLAKFRSQRG